MKNTNCIIIHGGGLVDPSKVVIMRFAKNLAKKQLYKKIWIGRYSFVALYTREFWLEYCEQLEEELKSKRGTFLGTCRDIDLIVRAEETIKLLKEENISTVYVWGGDGSSRNVAEIVEIFEKHGIKIVFLVPLTVDGINGGVSWGIEQAVRETVRQTGNIVATSLETLDSGEFSVVAMETQGRNRDDIMVRTLEFFVSSGQIADCMLEDIFLIAIPKTIPTNFDKLIELVNASTKRTLILLNEGAEIKLPQLAEKLKRKVRTLVVGHQSQSNQQTTRKDAVKYGKVIKRIVDMVARNPHQSFSVSLNNGRLKKQPIDYYAKLNPRKAQDTPLPEEQHKLVEKYVIS